MKSNLEFEAIVQAFEKINNSTIKLIDGLSKHKEEKKYIHTDIESKFIRIVLANKSILNSVEGVTFVVNQQERKIIDIFSIYSLTRMQIESFLMIYYLYFDEIDLIERVFRYDIYKLKGLKKQSTFPVNNKENRVKKEKIISEIEELELKIQDSEFYKKLTIKEKHDFLNSSFAKIIKPEILYKKSGLNNSKIDLAWSLYSNHIHSEHIGDRQYNVIYKSEDLINETAITVVTLNCIITAKLCLYLKNEFPDSVKKEYDKLDDSEQGLIIRFSII